jgi:HK97 family phage portal protein
MIANANRILWLPGDDSRNWDYESGGWASSNRNPSGVKIDAETALRSTVVLACIRVLSTSVAGLPLHLYRRLAGGGKEIAREHPLYRILHTQPNSWQTSFEWREQMMLHLLTTGAAFDEKVYAGGTISEIVPLHPSRMKVEQIENMRLRYTYREASGSSTVYTQDAIMSVRGMSDDGVHGLSMIEMARDAIGLSRACEIHGASFFGNGARPGVVLSTDQMLSPEAAENTRNQWERAHRGADRAHKTAVLQGGLKVNELGGNNQEAQFLEARRFQVEEICRLWGVPPHLVGDLSRSSYSNIEQQSLDYVQNGLMPWLRRIESAIARDLLEGDDEYFAEFDTRGSLRADAAGRATYYNTLWQLGVASVNEIRAWENMNPVEGGDTRFVQLNMTTLEKAAAEPEVPVVEEVITVEEPAADAPVADEPQQLADVSLNGAQIASLLEILTQVSTGLITPDAAQALVMASFPSIPQPMIDRILAGTSTQPVAEEPAPEPVAEPEVPAAASLPVSRDCGTGSGGFKPGNKCAPGGSGGGSSRYREAKTREEAEQVAKSYASNVSFRGVDVASANKINKSLDEFFEAHPDAPQMYAIEAKKFNGRGGMSEDAAAAYDMVNNRLFINTAIMGSEKKYNEHLSSAESARQSVERALASGSLSPSQEATATRLLSGKSVVDSSFEGAVIHEMGHHFDSSVLMKADKAARAQIMDRRSQYEGKLSTYASKNAFEYFAESYVAHRRGLEIDPELKAIFSRKGG